MSNKPTFKEKNQGDRKFFELKLENIQTCGNKKKWDLEENGHA
jgi:hypothetical protein